MAEVFGAVAGSLSIAALFNNCVDCFEYIRLGREFAKDYQTTQLKLDLCRLRLSRWGEAVKINDENEFQKRFGSDSERAKIVLAKLLDHFARAASSLNGVGCTSNRRGSSSSSSSNQQQQALVISDQDIYSNLYILHKNLSAQAKKRQKSTGMLKKAYWAIYQKKFIDRLIVDIKEFIDDLEVAFPAQNVCCQLVNEEVKEIVANEQDLLIIEETACETDSLLYEVTHAKIVNREAIVRAKTWA